MDERGYFQTGDIGFLDAGGYVVISGRLKDVIIRKGENISAKEVEDHVFAHPDVARRRRRGPRRRQASVNAAVR